jgi:hypothetical protein
LRIDICANPLVVGIRHFDFNTETRSSEGDV